MSKASGPLTAYAELLNALHALWKPHGIQVAPGKALFNDNVKRIMLRFGRQSGKSELISYMAVRWALTRPGSRIGVICPTLKQCRSLYLHSNKIETKIPRLYLQDIHKTDGRFTFTNGSTVELYGVDEQDSLRGPTFHAVFVDELKDLPDGALDSVIIPTTAVHKAPVVIAGTPPDVAEHPYWKLVEEFETSSDSRIFLATSYETPWITKEWVDSQRAKLEKRGELDVFRREYLAEYVPGQKRLAFPMLTKQDHVKPYATLINQIRRDPSKWNFFCVCDPGTASVFGILLAAVHKYDARIYLLDEVYENRQSETSVGKIWPRAREKIKEVYDEEIEWSVIYDEAAAWFRSELQDRYFVNAMPTHKSQNKKGAGISAVRDVLHTKHMQASDRLVNWFREMQVYSFNDLGIPIKVEDHLVDCTLYLLPAANYTSVEEDAPPVPDQLTPGQIDDPKRAFTVEDDYKPSDVDLWDGEEYYGWGELEDL